MEKVKDIIKQTWANHRPVVLVVALAVVVAAVGATALYLERQPPEDVSNSDAEFVEGDTQKPIRRHRQLADLRPEQRPDALPARPRMSPLR